MEQMNEMVGNNYIPYLEPRKPDYEIIEGVKIMAPSPKWEHGIVTSSLVAIFMNYCYKYDNGLVFGDNMDIHLPNSNNIFKPDLSVFKDKSIFKHGKKIYGVPDLVVEILSPATAKRDLGIKKDIYERSGVKEYWIVNHQDRSVQVYHLIDGKYTLDHVYHDYTEFELQNLEDETVEIRNEIKVSIFDDLLVEVSNIFYGLD